MTDYEAQIAELKRALAAKDDELAAKDDELAQQRALTDRLAADAQEKARTIAELRHKLDQLARQLFGRKAESVDPNQLRLAFDQAEAEGETPPPFVDEAPDDESQRPRGKKRGKRNGRLELPADLPRERREIHPETCDLSCPCGGERRRIGEEITEQLDYRPASFRVIEHVRVKYACASCQEGVLCPDPPAFPLDKKRPSRPSSRLLAEVVVSKFGDHLPLNRLEGVFARQGVRIPKSTLSDWLRDLSVVLEPIVAVVEREVLANDAIQTDETGIRVRDPTLSKRTKAGRIWIYAGQPGQALFRYTPTKEGKHAAKFLSSYRGYLQADAYSGFDRLYRDGSIVEVACWAHARRKFFEAKEASPVEAAWALHAISKLFEVEREASEAELDAEQRKQLRAEKSRPLVESFFEWLVSLGDSLLPRSPLKKAVGYALNQREALCRFLEDGRLKLDNNRAERCLRQVAVGRKNWLFAGHANGAHRAAAFYTLVVSCREAGLDPTEYLADVITKASSPDFPASRVGELTPYAWAQRRAAEAASG